VDVTEEGVMIEDVDINEALDFDCIDGFCTQRAFIQTSEPNDTHRTDYWFSTLSNSFVPLALAEEMALNRRPPGYVNWLSLKRERNEVSDLPYADGSYFPSISNSRLLYCRIPKILYS
jgi:hypothetical protein